MATIASNGSANYPESIILGPGDTITGEFRRLEQGRMKDGGSRIIAVLGVDGVERALWLHEKALRGQFADLKPEPGETVRVAKGAEKKRSANGFDYWPIWVTAPEREPIAIGWDDPLFSADQDDADNEFEF